MNARVGGVRVACACGKLERSPVCQGRAAVLLFAYPLFISHAVMNN